MPHHPEDRNTRRQLARIYDGDRQLIRDMEKKYRMMWARDILAIDEEWNCLDELSIGAYVLALQAGEYLRESDDQ